MKAIMQELEELIKEMNAVDHEDYSGRLVEAFGRLKGKLSFCSLG